MSDAIVAEMQMIMRRLAEPRQPGDSVKAAIDRASRRAGIGFRRARSFWYGTSRAVLAAEADRLREADLRQLRLRREALAQELDDIEARLNARGHKNGLDQDDLSRHGLVLPASRQGVEATRGVVREARVASAGREG